MNGSVVFFHFYLCFGRAESPLLRGLFWGCGEWGLLPGCGAGFSLQRPLVAERGLAGPWASELVTLRLR